MSEYVLMVAYGFQNPMYFTTKSGHPADPIISKIYAATVPVILGGNKGENK